MSKNLEVIIIIPTLKTHKQFQHQIYLKNFKFNL